MRLEILLSPKELKYTIPINYNDLIYKSFNSIFTKNEKHMNSWLLDDFSRHLIQEKTKLFTFSKLLNQKSKVIDFSLTGFGDTKLLFSAPINRNKVPLFIEKLWSNKGLKMITHNSAIDFHFKRIKYLEEPEFGTFAKFIMISPTTISKVSYNNSNKSIHFLRVYERDTEGAIAHNLRKKYKLVYNAYYNGPLEVRLDREYIDNKGGPESVSKLITIRQGTSKEYRIKGFVAPISIKGTPELLKIAYQCGIGEKNSLGMGMLELVKKDTVINDDDDNCIYECKAV